LPLEALQPPTADPPIVFLQLQIARKIATHINQGKAEQ